MRWRQENRLCRFRQEVHLQEGRLILRGVLCAIKEPEALWTSSVAS